MALAAGTLVACLGPQTPASKADEAVRELNSAARWGRMDIALSRSADEDREGFLERHADWHNGTRIVDSEVAGIHLIDATHAIVHVDVSWTLADDTTLRVTRIEQEWSDAEGKWVLESEKRVGGALGLFGEDIEHAEPRADRHFPTRVIR